MSNLRLANCLAAVLIESSLEAKGDHPSAPAARSAPGPVAATSGLVRASRALLTFTARSGARASRR